MLRPPLRMNGTGKIYLIHCLRRLLSRRVRVAAPTGVAAFNMEGHTLHYLLSLPVKGEYKDLEGERLCKIQQSLSSMEYLIIYEIPWWEGILLVKWTSIFGKCSLIMLTYCLDVAPACS